MQQRASGRYERPDYILRADIKSFYASIPHYKLVQDIRIHYDDPKVQAMLENIITNPVDTPRGYKNPSRGIALRGPLSQFFSGIYLKPLDDAFDKSDVTYLRFQDDILILCKTKTSDAPLPAAHDGSTTGEAPDPVAKKKRVWAVSEVAFIFSASTIFQRKRKMVSMQHHALVMYIPTPNNIHYLNEIGGG